MPITASSPITAYTCAPRVAGVLDAIAGRPTSRIATHTTAPIGNASAGRYHPLIASRRPTPPNASTPAAVARATARNQAGGVLSVEGDAATPAAAGVSVRTWVIGRPSRVVAPVHRGNRRVGWSSMTDLASSV